MFVMCNLSLGIMLVEIRILIVYKRSYSFEIIFVPEFLCCDLDKNYLTVIVNAIHRHIKKNENEEKTFTMSVDSSNCLSVCGTRQIRHSASYTTKTYT